MSTDILSPEFLDNLDRVQPEVEEIYRYADLTGVFLMGLVGGTIARQKGYDIIGFLFLALFSALGGGMLRDALIQKGTVAAIAEREYLILAFSGALIAWLAHFKGRLWDRFQAHADAVISGAWAVTGAAKALTWDLPFLAALFMGVLTATGGSMIRDVVTGERPKAFGGGQLVVAPALVAASVYAVFHYLEEPVLGMIVGAVAGTALAIVSYWFGWHFPANPDFAPANTAAREARELAEAAGEKTMDVAAEVEWGYPLFVDTELAGHRALRKDVHMGQRRRYTDQYRRDAASLVLDTGQTIRAVAQQLDLGEQLLGSWVKKRTPPDTSREPVQKRSSDVHLN